MMRFLKKKNEQNNISFEIAHLKIKPEQLKFINQLNQSFLITS